VSDAITFDTSATDASATAAQALSLGRGVCQDLAHVFIAASRAAGLPTRYVSGHLLRADGESEQEASHAWAEVAIPGLGWVGFDPANRSCPTDAYVRVAIGLDYLHAAPVRGARNGGGAERMTVKLNVSPAWSQTQSQSQSGGGSQSQSQSRG
jgi:transglutaminase-like putative cysteine protease